jgi:hypothetical protein
MVRRAKQVPAQDRFVVVAEVTAARVQELRDCLAAITLPGMPGAADPDNAILPFGHYETIHFARFVVLEDHTLGDRSAWPELPPTEPVYVLFMADCDGGASALLRRLAAECPRLREVFDHCVDPPRSDLAAWLFAHRLKPVASYVNWVGRTVIQVREEATLRAALKAALPQTTEKDPRKLHAELRRLVSGEITLTALSEYPFRQWSSDFLGLLWPLVLVVVAFLVFPLAMFCIVVAGAVAFAVTLRRHEQMDPVQENSYDSKWVARLRLGEDHDVSNQYTAIGSIRPGWFRRVVARAVLWGINRAAQVVFTRGGLARVGTIHFAHWIFLDSYRRVVFCSNYDGAHEAYMDDFINKVGFGLNLSFSGTIAYPQTDWLIAKGAWREQLFKRFQRYHQIPTDVWYKAYPGLTARDLSRNSLVRNGFEHDDMDDDEIRRWLAEI